MRIRDKLTLSFSFTVSLILLTFGLAVYYFSSQYRKSEFYNRLKARVDITEKMFLEKENFSERDFKRIEDQFLNRLPEETEEVIPMSADFRKHVKHNYPENFLEELATNEVAYFQQGDRQGSGRVFHLKDGDFVVILTAIDKVGIHMMSYLVTIIVLALAGSILSIIFVSYFFSGKILNPISKKIQKANAISVRNLHERLMVYDPDDEIGELAIAFNKMLDRLGTAFEAQKSFIDNASHEMRNPLTAIIGEADVALAKERTTGEYTESLRSISHEAERLNNLVNNLLQLATISYRDVPFKRELVEVKNLLAATKKKFDFSCPENQVEIRLDSEMDGIRPLFVKGNKHLLQTALINILDNASKFSFNNPVEVNVYRKKRTLTISVRDSGVGIPSEDIPKVTQPFHRAPNVRNIKGTGIGIPLTVKIIELHQGNFEISSELNRGTEARINLPVAE
jgi:signal transduction histidine kinase